MAGIGGGLGAAAGVLAFGSTTTQVLIASAAGFLIGAAIGFFLATRIKDGPAAARTDRLLKADVVARILIADRKSVV